MNEISKKAHLFAIKTTVFFLVGLGIFGMLLMFEPKILAVLIGLFIVFILLGGMYSLLYDIGKDRQKGE